MIKTYDDDSNQLCDFYEEGESFEGLFDFCQGYCDNCNDHPNCMYRENLKLKEQLKIATHALQFYSDKQHLKETIELEYEKIETYDNKHMYYVEGHYPIEAGYKAQEALSKIND